MKGSAISSRNRQNPINPRKIQQVLYLAKKKSMVQAQGTANAMRTRSALSRPKTRIGIHSSNSTQDMLNMTLAGALVYKNDNDNDNCINGHAAEMSNASVKKKARKRI